MSSFIQFTVIENLQIFPCIRKIYINSGVAVDLKIDNLDRISIHTKIVATFDVEHPIHGTTYAPNHESKSVNIDTISISLRVYCLNLNVD